MLWEKKKNESIFLFFSLLADPGAKLTVLPLLLNVIKTVLKKPEKSTAEKAFSSIFRRTAGPGPQWHECIVAVNPSAPELMRTGRSPAILQEGNRGAAAASKREPP